MAQKQDPPRPKRKAPARAGTKAAAGTRTKKAATAQTPPARARTGRTTPRRPVTSKDGELTLHAEQLRVDTERTNVGAVKARKTSSSRTVEQRVPRSTERADVERTPAQEGDSGRVETLSDGSLSIPLFEEQIVVTKKLVVRERVVLRKRTVLEEQVVTAELRREELDVQTVGDVEVVKGRAEGE